MNFSLNLFLVKKLAVIIILFFFLITKINFVYSGFHITDKNKKNSGEYWFQEAINFNPNDINLPLVNSSIKLAIIDSGFNVSLPSLINNTWINTGEIKDNAIDDDKNGYVDDYFGFDFVNNKTIIPNAESYTSHASFIANQLGGQKTTDILIPGMLSNISLVNIRILDNKNRISEENWDIVAQALIYAIQIQSDIILMSSEFQAEPPEFVKESFSKVSEAQIPLITISGNTGGEITSYPALLDSSITVGAIKGSLESHSYTHASYSNIGLSVDIVAPGTDITSYDVGGKETILSGTSFSAPYVAGTVAWMKIINKSLTVDKIKEILVSTATKTGNCYSNGAGILNFSKAISVTKGLLPLPVNIEANKTLCEINNRNDFSLGIDFISLIEIYGLVLIIMTFVKRRKIERF